MTSSSPTRRRRGIARRSRRAGRAKPANTRCGWFGTDDLVVDRKGDGTPVTEADRAAERLVRTG